MLDIFFKGGPVMYVILAVSIYALGVFIERLWYLARIRLDSDLLLADLARLVEKRDLAAAAEIVRRVGGPAVGGPAVGSPLPEIFRAGFEHLNRGLDSARDAMMRVGEAQLRMVEGNTRHLAIVANLSTMLGLLGTITGMITAFDAIAAKGLGNPAVVATGVGQALITTAYGLIVAIPAIIAYNYIESRVEAVKVDCEDKTGRLLDALELAGR